MPSSSIRKRIEGTAGAAAGCVVVGRVVGPVGLWGTAVVCSGGPSKRGACTRGAAGARGSVRSETWLMNTEPAGAIDTAGGCSVATALAGCLALSRFAGVSVVTITREAVSRNQRIAWGNV